MTIKGKALVEGVAGAMDLYAYVTNESLKAAQQWDEETAANDQGAVMSWVPRNERIELDVTVKLSGDTIAHAKSGAAFLAPYAAVVLTTFDLTWLNATWQYIGGSTIDLADSKHGMATVKLRKYADSTQQTAATTTAS